MKKYVLSLALASLAVGTIVAGEPGKIGFHGNPVIKNVVTKKAAVVPVTPTSSAPARAARTLDKIPLSSAGNLYTVLNSACNQIYTNDSLNTAIFIHRSDVPPATCCPGSNIAQYRFDISKDGGQNWTSNIGVLNPLANNADYSSRYPQTAIYRNMASLVPDSSYMVYTGTWHNGAANAIWEGESHGAAQLSGDPATFKTQRDTINSGNLLPGFSFTQGAPGKFYNLSYDYHDLGGNVSNIAGLVYMKGVWDDNLKDVVWTNQLIPIVVDNFTDANQNVQGSVIGSAVVAFDPSGQNGWLVFKGDMEIDNFYVERLYAMRSTDFGNTWSAPTLIDLDNNVEGMFTLPQVSVSGNDVGVSHSIQGDIDIAVDNTGNVHIGCIVSIADTSSSQYQYFPNQGMYVYDIYSSTGATCWKSHMFHRVYAVDGNYTVASGTDAAVNEGNRFQGARSEDGKKIFFFWNDTDSSLVASQTTNVTNVSPNLFGVGINLETGMTTDMVNFTAGDPQFGGTVGTSFPEGTFHGSLFPVVSATAFSKASLYKVPVVLTQPDYNNTGSNLLGGNPAKFYICRNIDFPFSSFNIKLDNNKPNLALIGQDSVSVLLHSVYNDAGVTKSKCGEVLPTPVFSSNVNKDSVGIYTVTYTVTDASGNTATVTRTVFVSAAPIAIIKYKQNWGNNFTFRDSSLYLPTSRTWLWGDGTGKSNVTVFTKQYSSAGQKMVTLTVSNQFGTDKDTVFVNVALGIEDETFSNAISVSPNPSSGVFILHSAEENNLEVTVYDLTGKAILPKTVLTKAGNSGFRIDLSALSAGLYLLKVENGKSMAVKEVSVVR